MEQLEIWKWNSNNFTIQEICIMEQLEQEKQERNMTRAKNNN